MTFPPSRRRATVVVRQHDPETDDFATEWCHTDDLETDEVGVTLSWDLTTTGGYRTFVPWASVVRIEYEPCACIECAPGKPVLPVKASSDPKEAKR